MSLKRAGYVRGLASSHVGRCPNTVVGLARRPSVWLSTSADPAERRRSSPLATLSLLGSTRRSFCTAPPPKVEKPVGPESEEDYLAARWEALEAVEGQGRIKAYPHYSSSSSATQGRALSIEEFVQKFNHLKPAERLDNLDVEVTGRITSKRESGKKILFYDIRSRKHVLQVMAVEDKYRPHSTGDKPALSFAEINGLLKRGDIILARGYPGKTKTGELSIIPTQITLLSPCLRHVPEVLTHRESRHRRRYLDLLVNENVRDIFVTRAKVINFIRQFLNERQFLEVETPTLAPSAGGANALPFVTHSRGLSANLFMRIAPELYLKQLVIGGLERVYEIGKCFRNEGVDAFHNPEFTTVEFYQAWADYYDVQNMTETLLHDLVVHVTGSPTLTVHMHHGDADDDEEHGSSSKQVTIDFTPPFKRVNILEEIERHTGTLPPYGTPDCAGKLHQICINHGVSVHEPYTYSRLLDALCGRFIESHIVQPTFLCNHPLVLSPLAKQHRDNPALTERFELFIAGKEICNAYTELNDPREQRRRFRWQAEAQKEGDAEAQTPDEGFCEALEYGLPPTAGWGLGIDRLIMLLTGTSHIREVLLYPTMKPKGEPPATQV